MNLMNFIIREGRDAFWPLDYFLGNIIITLIAVLFSGMTFVQQLLLLGVDIVLKFGIGLTLGISREQSLLQEGGDANKAFTAVSQFILLINLLPAAAAFHVMFIFVVYVGEAQARRRFLENLILTHLRDLRIQQKTKNEALQRMLLYNLLPSGIVDRIEEGNAAAADAGHAGAEGAEEPWFSYDSLAIYHESAAIMFTRVVDFHALARVVSTPEVMRYLNELFGAFDSLCERHNAYKVETVGSEYVACVGVMSGDGE